MPVWSAGTQVAPGSGGFELASDALHLESKGRWAGPWECGAHRHTRAGGPQTRQDQADIAPATPGPRQGRTCRGRICVTAVSSELSREAALAGCVCAGGAVRAEPHPPEGRRLVSDPREDAFLPDVAERPVQVLPQLRRPLEAGPSGIKSGSPTHSLGPPSAEPPPSASGPRGCGRCCRWKRLDGTRYTRGASVPMAPPTSQRIARVRVGEAAPPGGLLTPGLHTVKGGHCRSRAFL